MDIRSILEWLNQCPVLGGQNIAWNYLPSYSGWSLTVVKSAVRTDILGGAIRSYTLKITRRHTVQNSADRLAVIRNYTGPGKEQTHEFAQ